jgi:phosphate transport system substrate-binding protein
MKSLLSVVCGLAVWGLFCAPAAAQIKVDKGLPDYAPTTGVTGTIQSVGSDTMGNLMAAWSEGFTKIYPNVKTDIKSGGSSEAPAALIAGTALFGPMSREMKASEVDSFEKKFGYKPAGLGTSIDMLAVYVNKDNPIKGLTLPQVDAIFSKTRNLGSDKDIVRWGELGLKGDFADAPISLYGRNEASGTYGYFKEIALGNGDYKDSVKTNPGSSTVVQGVAKDRFGIGYSGIGYKTADVNAVPLAKNDESDPIEVTPENVAKYPLARILYFYVNHKPGKELGALRREFIKYVYSKSGQEVVIKQGFLPLSAKQAEKGLKTVGLSFADYETK